LEALKSSAKVPSLKDNTKIDESTSAAIDIIWCSTASNIAHTLDDYRSGSSNFLRLEADNDWPQVGSIARGKGDRVSDFNFLAKCFTTSNFSNTNEGLYVYRHRRRRQVPCSSRSPICLAVRLNGWECTSFAIRNPPTQLYLVRFLWTDLLLFQKWSKTSTKTHTRALETRTGTGWCVLQESRFGSSGGLDFKCR